ACGAAPLARPGGRRRAAREGRGGALRRSLGRRRARGRAVKVLFVSRERHRLPLDDVQRRKWDAIAAEVEPRVLASAPDGFPTEDGRFRLAPPFRVRALDGAAFYATLPVRCARERRSVPPPTAR